MYLTCELILFLKQIGVVCLVSPHRKVWRLLLGKATLGDPLSFVFVLLVRDRFGWERKHTAEMRASLFMEYS